MKRILIVAAIIISGLFWYLSCDLSGNYWYLLWIAPIPVLLVSFHVSAKQTFFVAFIAYLVGRLSWLSYLLSVLPVPLAIVFTVLLPLIFAFVVVLTRRIVLAKQNGWSVFVFPVLGSLFEFLFFKFSPDGTAGSIAYSQANFLPVVQTASVTGILGITFLVTLFPSVIAVAIYYRKKRHILISSFLIFVLIIAVLLFGIIRMNNSKPNENEITAGLAVIDEKFHNETNTPVSANEINTANLYAEQIAKLASQGAAVAVLPEKMINITPETDSVIKSIFVNAGIKNHITIVAGYTQFKNGTKRNMALVISPEGKILADYQKVNLFEGEALNGFTPGKEIAAFSLNNTLSGVAICKDLDYQNFMKKYGENNSAVLYVPAWDFVKDGWLHSRMAVLRGVENGYAVIRTARQGNLTISDYRGKVLYEASTAKGNAASLTGKVSLQKTETIYSKFGDWFGFIIVVAAAYFVLIAIREEIKSKV